MFHILCRSFLCAWPWALTFWPWYLYHSGYAIHMLNEVCIISERSVLAVTCAFFECERSWYVFVMCRDFVTIHTRCLKRSELLLCFGHNVGIMLYFFAKLTSLLELRSNCLALKAKDVCRIFSRCGKLSSFYIHHFLSTPIILLFLFSLSRDNFHI